MKAIEKDDGNRERDVKRNDRQNPEHALFVTQLRSPTHPERSDDEHNLGENEIEKPELFFEDGTTRLDVMLSFGDGWRGFVVFSVHQP